MLKVSIIIPAVIYRVPTMFCYGIFKCLFIRTLSLQVAMWLVWGRGELLMKDTELSRGTSSRAGRQPSLPKEAEPEEEKVIRN